MAGYLFAMGSKEAAMKCMRTGIYSTYVKPTWNSAKLDIENPIIRINTAFKGCSSLEKISVLPRIYHN